jgi:hypothetical protein
MSRSASLALNLILSIWMLTALSKKIDENCDLAQLVENEYIVAAASWTRL